MSADEQPHSGQVVSDLLMFDLYENGEHYTSQTENW